MTTCDVTLIGTGALASLLAARLSRAGSAVTLTGTWQDALDAVRRRGIRVEDRSGRWSAAADSVNIVDRSQRAPLVLVLVKSPRTSAVAEAAARASLPQGTILTLQNGLGNREILAAAAGADRVSAGAAFLGATLLGPAEVRDGGGSLVVLEAGGRISYATRMFRAAGFDVVVEADITAVQWAKVAVNCAINPLTALLRVPNGTLLEDPQARATLESAAREVGVVAAAQGIRLTGDPAALALEVARNTAQNRSSMLQDIDRGAPTEIEALNGAVVREAERLGIPVPVNRRLLEDVRRIECRRPRDSAGGGVPGGVR